MDTRMHCKAATVLLAILAFAGCSLIRDSSPTATVRDFYRYAESDNPEAMVSLYSKAYLERNKDALERCREIIAMSRASKVTGHPPSLVDLKETLFGEKAVVKGYYGPTDGSGRGAAFQSRLVKENGEWKIELTTTNLYTDLTKE